MYSEMHRCIRCHDKEPPFSLEGFCHTCWKKILWSRASKRHSNLFWEALKNMESKAMSVKVKRLGDLKGMSKDVSINGSLSFEGTSIGFTESMEFYCGKVIQLNNQKAHDLEKQGSFFHDSWNFHKSFLEGVLDREFVTSTKVTGDLAFKKSVGKSLSEKMKEKRQAFINPLPTTVEIPDPLEGEDLAQYQKQEPDILLDKHAIGEEEVIKNDSGKPRYSLVLGDFRHAIEEVVRVGTCGAKKYEDSNWLKVENGIERYGDALLRHFWEGDKSNEEDFGLSHAAHAAWNALARLEFMILERDKKNV